MTITLAITLIIAIIDIIIIIKCLKPMQPCEHIIALNVCLEYGPKLINIGLELVLLPTIPTESKSQSEHSNLPTISQATPAADLLSRGLDADAIFPREEEIVDSTHPLQHVP